MNRRRSSGGRRNGMSPFAIIGIILVILAVIVVAVVCCRKKRLSKGVVVHKKIDSGKKGTLFAQYLVQLTVRCLFLRRAWFWVLHSCVFDRHDKMLYHTVDLKVELYSS